MKFDINGVFEDLSEKFKFRQNRTRIVGALYKDQYTFLSYLAYFFLEWEMLQTYVVEKIKTHIFCSLAFFENRTIYEKMWKNIVELGWTQMIMWRIRIARCVPKAINIHTQCT
jgi:hypothetical protein